MAAQKKEINLLPKENWENSPVGQAVTWVLTVGRYIVILTELVVIIAFLSRFKIDRDLANLYEQTEIKAAQVEALSNVENQFLQTQKRLKAVKELIDSGQSQYQSLKTFVSYIPDTVILEELELSFKEISAQGVAISVSGLEYLTQQLVASEMFTDVELGKISQNRNLEIDFSLSAKIKLTENE